jgi:hypothetical protein
MSPQPHPPTPSPSYGEGERVPFKLSPLLGSADGNAPPSSAGLPLSLRGATATKQSFARPSQCHQQKPATAPRAHPHAPLPTPLAIPTSLSPSPHRRRGGRGVRSSPLLARGGAGGEPRRRPFQSIPTSLPPLCRAERGPGGEVWGPGGEVSRTVLPLSVDGEGAGGGVS